MFTYKTGNILTDDVEAIVNTVNCVGVMGFKKSYPENFKAYAAACKNEEVQPGHWKGKSRMEDIEAGLVALAEGIRSRGIRSIAIPPCTTMPYVFCDVPRRSYF